jgi:hypothetical protein
MKTSYTWVLFVVECVQIHLFLNAVKMHQKLRVKGGFRYDFSGSQRAFLGAP